METQKRRIPRILYATIATVVFWGAHIYSREFMKLQPGDNLRLVLTSAVVLSFLWMVLEHVKQARQLDEFHRQVHYLALAVAFPSALVLLFALGFFRAEGFFSGADSRDLPMLMVLSYAAGWAIA